MAPRCIILALLVVSVEGIFKMPAVMYSLYSDYWCNATGLHGNITVVSGTCMSGVNLGDGLLATSYKYTCYDNGKKVQPYVYSGANCTGNVAMPDPMEVNTCLRGVKFACHDEHFTDNDYAAYTVYTATIQGVAPNTDTFHLTSGLCQSGMFVNNVLTSHANSSFLINCLKPVAPSTTPTAQIQNFNCLSCACSSATTEVSLPHALSNPEPTGQLTCESGRIWNKIVHPPSDDGYSMPCGLTVVVVLFSIIAGGLLLFGAKWCIDHCKTDDDPTQVNRRATEGQAKEEPGCAIPGLTPGESKDTFNAL